MDAHYIQVMWTWIVRIFVTLGGFAGLTKIFEWYFNRAKIIGEVEQRTIGTVTQDNGALVGAHIMLQVYLVNKRIKPTTVKGWRLEVDIKGQHYIAENWAIPDNFVVSDRAGKPYPIDFSSCRLYDIAGLNLLEYGKGIRGWLRFLVRGISGDDVSSGAKLKLVVKDALKGKHTIWDEVVKGVTSPPSYYPGAGVKIT